MENCETCKHFLTKAVERAVESCTCSPASLTSFLLASGIVLWLIGLGVFVLRFASKQAGYLSLRNSYLISVQDTASQRLPEDLCKALPWSRVQSFCLFLKLQNPFFVSFHILCNCFSIKLRKFSEMTPKLEGFQRLPHNLPSVPSPFLALRALSW